MGYDPEETLAYYPWSLANIAVGVLMIYLIIQQLVRVHRSNYYPSTKLLWYIAFAFTSILSLIHI